MTSIHQATDAKRVAATMAEDAYQEGFEDALCSIMPLLREKHWHTSDSLKTNILLLKTIPESDK